MVERQQGRERPQCVFDVDPQRRVKIPSDLWREVGGLDPDQVVLLTRDEMRRILIFPTRAKFHDYASDYAYYLSTPFFGEYEVREWLGMGAEWVPVGHGGILTVPQRLFDRSCIVSEAVVTSSRNCLVIESPLHAAGRYEEILAWWLKDMGHAMERDEEEKDACHHLLRLVQPVNQEFMEVLNRDPSLLYEIRPRQFEELVAELMSRAGFDVTLTPETRDHGRDILAVLRVPLVKPILTVVECKKLARHRKVGPDVVQRLLWIKDNYDGASHAMVVTTAYFSQGAKLLAQDFPWTLSLADFGTLREWLRRYGVWVQDREAMVWTPWTP